MLAVRLRKDTITGKQLVDGWSIVTKEYAATHAEIPGERVYIQEKDVPASFWRNYAIHYCDNHQIRVLYPNKVEYSPFKID